MSIIKSALLVTFIAMLAACSTTEGEFPSLERRPYESNAPITEPVALPVAPVSLPTEIATKVDAILARHRRAQSAFAAGLGSVRSVALSAAGNSSGSESWVNAHVQLSRLDKTRADSVAAAREFDSLISETGVLDSAFVGLLTAAQKPVVDDVTSQNSEIDRLSRLIGE
jgi:hypothetical protein